MVSTVSIPISLHCLMIQIPLSTIYIELCTTSMKMGSFWGGCNSTSSPRKITTRALRKTFQQSGPGKSVAIIKYLDATGCSLPPFIQHGQTSTRRMIERVGYMPTLTMSRPITGSVSSLLKVSAELRRLGQRKDNIAC
jgi:hypothetical protein